MQDIISCAVHFLLEAVKAFTMEIYIRIYVRSIHIYANHSIQILKICCIIINFWLLVFNMCLNLAEPLEGQSWTNCSDQMRWWVWWLFLLTLFWFSICIIIIISLTIDNCFLGDYPNSFLTWWRYLITISIRFQTIHDSIITLDIKLKILSRDSGCL